MKQEYDPETTTQLATRIPRGLHRAVLLAAVAEEVSVKEWVADALVSHLAAVRENPVPAVHEDTGKPGPPSRARRARPAA
jgi:hypothetical protein